MKTLQKFASVYANVHSYPRLEHHLARQVAVARGGRIAAGGGSAYGSLLRLELPAR